MWGVVRLTVTRLLEKGIDALAARNTYALPPRILPLILGTIGAANAGSLVDQQSPTLQ